MKRHKIVNFLGIKIKIQYGKDYIYQIKQFFGIKPWRYKIIPLGMYCLPRIIVTRNGMKPSKAKGELTCPFDLVFIKKFNSVTKLLQNNFSNLYDVEFNEEWHCWFNKELDIYFVHEKNFTKEDFIERYNNRIKNLHTYFEDDKYFKHILISVRMPIKRMQVTNLKRALSKMINGGFDIIIINQWKKPIEFSIKGVHIVEQSQNYELFESIQEDFYNGLRDNRTASAYKIYKELTQDLKRII